MDLAMNISSVQVLDFSEVIDLLTNLVISLVYI